MLRLYQPCLPTRAVKPPSGEQWIHEIKHDGFRIVAPVIFEHACKLGLEGIVCKRVDMAYRAGPSKSWIKVKNKKHPAMLRVKEAFELERQCGR